MKDFRIEEEIERIRRAMNSIDDSNHENDILRKLVEARRIIERISESD